MKIRANDISVETLFVLWVTNALPVKKHFRKIFWYEADLVHNSKLGFFFLKKRSLPKYWLDYIEFAPCFKQPTIAQKGLIGL